MQVTRGSARGDCAYLLSAVRTLTSSPSSPLLSAKLTVLLCALRGEPGAVELVLSARPFMEEARDVRRPLATGMKDWASVITLATLLPERSRVER